MIKKCRLSTFWLQMFHLIYRGKNSHNDFTLEIQVRTDEAVPGGLLLFFPFYNWQAFNGSLSRLIHCKNLPGGWWNGKLRSNPSWSRMNATPNKDEGQKCTKNRLQTKTDILGGNCLFEVLGAKQEVNLQSVAACVSLWMSCMCTRSDGCCFLCLRGRCGFQCYPLCVCVYVCACTGEGVGDLSLSLTRLWPAEMIQE